MAPPSLRPHHEGPLTVGGTGEGAAHAKPADARLTKQAPVAASAVGQDVGGMLSTGIAGTRLVAHLKQLTHLPQWLKLVSRSTHVPVHTSGLAARALNQTGCESVTWLLHRHRQMHAGCLRAHRLSRSPPLLSWRARGAWTAWEPCRRQPHRCCPLGIESCSCHSAWGRSWC